MRKLPSGPRRTSAWRSSWRDAVASRNFTATRQARDIGREIGSPVLDLTQYRLQNVDANARLFIRESGRTAPMPNHRPHVIPPGGWYGPFRLFADTATDARGVWAWSDRDGCACVVTDLPS